MANTDFIQATIELFGSVIMAIMAMSFIIITRNERRSQKDLFALLLASGFSLMVDAGWYIFDGMMTPVGSAMNRICNLAIFICNPIMVILLNRYVSNLMREEGNKPKKGFMVSAYLIAILALCIPFTNLVYKWMYFIDEANIYHRMTGWYVYAVLNTLSMIVCFIMIIAHTGLIPLKKRLPLYLLFIVQLTAIVLQVTSIGISFIQLGTAFGDIVIVASYLVEWFKSEKNSTEISEDRKKVWLIELVFSILILFISSAIISSVVSVKSVSKESSEQNSISLAYMINETIEGSLSIPINVSRTMAQSEIIREALSMDQLENTDTEARMIAYMRRLKEKYNYQMVFVATEKSKAYYTYDGLSRYMNTSQFSVDSWYSDFRKQKKEYELNIDADKDNNMRLAVFVNMEVKDENGEVIGVCGVAMSMESFMDVLSQYEDEYQLDISVVNERGLYQIDTERIKIDREYYDITKLESISPTGIHYQRFDQYAILIKYMGSYGWYLIIEDYNPDKLNLLRMIMPSVTIYIIGVLLMLAVSIAYGIYERRRTTELRETKLESETAQAENVAKGRFLANMSHEIRTPINAVLGMDTMILRESSEPKIKEYAMVIKNSGNILLSLINDILDISKIESGKMEIIPEDYSLPVLVGDVMNMISLKADKKGLDVKLEIDPILPTGLYGDVVRLRQIIINLMNNAIKYTEQGGVILIVNGQQDKDTVKLNICVQDTGIGIREEDLHKLFEDFVRIEEFRNRNIEGTGLGMSITVQLLELMHSKLQVESEYGTGSRFFFELEQKITDSSPVGDVSLHLLKESEDYEYSSLFTAPDAKVLVVDDNDVNRMVFINLLKETQVQIDDANCGKKALELVFANHYDLIFLDHMMPDMDGIEVMKRIAENREHPNTETPVIVLTANAISGAKETYLEAGFDDYLSKPIIPEQLEKTMFYYLSDAKMISSEKVVKQAVPQEEELPMIEGVDWHYAQLHLPNKEGLMNTLRSFVIAIDSEADELRMLYNNLIENPADSENLDLYRIKVHGMKSTSTLLGCVPIAGMAATLEMAAKENHQDVIRDLTPHFIEKWCEYKQKLSFAVRSSEDKKEIKDTSLMIDYFKQLKDASGAFDVHGADSVLEKLSQFRYNTEEKELIDRITIAVNNLDMDEVAGLCDRAIEIFMI